MTESGKRENMPMFEEIVFDGVLHAMIVRRDYHRPGVNFFTPENFSQQLGSLSHPAGRRIPPHIHRATPPAGQVTQEVLFMRTGRLRVDFHRADGGLLGSRTLEAGDVILLVNGGHGFEVLEDCEIFEVKQGSYTGVEYKMMLPVADRAAGTERPR
jgi:hypothetical protein